MFRTDHSSRIEARTIVLLFWLCGIALAQEPQIHVVSSAPPSGALGTITSGGVFRAAIDGKELVYLDLSVGSIRSYDYQTGKLSKKEVYLVRTDGSRVGNLGPAGAMAVQGNVVAVAGAMKPMAVFSLQTGRQVASSNMLVRDIMSFGHDWLAAAQYLPIMPSTKRAAGLPRLLVLNGDDLSVKKEALFIGEGKEKTARGLRVSATGSHIFAGELANYRIYRLSNGLKLRTTFEDPEFFRENVISEEEANEIANELLERGKQQLSQAGTDLVQPSGQVTSQPITTSVNHEPTLLDITWDKYIQRLVILVAEDNEGKQCLVDLLDPVSGQRNRFHVLASSKKFSCFRVSVTPNSIWLMDLKAKNEPIQVVSHEDLIGLIYDTEAEPFPNIQEHGNVK